MSNRLTTGDAPAAGSPQRVAYLVMSHTLPLQVLRLVRALRALSPEALIVVHHDQRVSRLEGAHVQAAGGGSLLSAPYRVQWGGISQVDALLWTLRWLEDNVDYDWVVHLSGQDYPVRPLREYETRLCCGEADAYLRFARVGTEADLTGRWQEEAVRRYFYRYRYIPAALARPLLHIRFGDQTRSMAKPNDACSTNSTASAPSGARPRRPWAVAKVVPDGRIGIGLPARWTPFTDGYSCYKGSYWVTLSRRAVRALLHARCSRPEVYEYFRRTWIPDESFVATLLGNDDSIRLSRDEYRYLDWTRHTAHPDVLTSADLPRVVASGRYLARKFDMSTDPAVLDALDELLGLTAVPEE